MGRWRRSAGRASSIAGVASIVSCASLASCATSTVGATAISLARPGAAWPSGVAPCVLETSRARSCGPSFDVLASAGGHPIARISRRDLVSIRWSDLPILGAARVAKVTASGEGMTVRGWASFEEERFELRSNAPIVRGHVWVPAGAQVEVLGTSGGDVVVQVPTPFAQPRSLEVATECGAFGSSPSRARVPIGPPFARPRARLLELRASPGGPVVFAFEPAPDAAFVLFGRSGESAHIAGGQAPWIQVLDEEALLIDGWVDRAQIRATDTLEESVDRDGGCGVLDSVDSCGSAFVTMPTPLHVGVGAPTEIIGELSGTVTTLGRSGEFIAVTTPNSPILAPLGARFWVLASAVTEDCTAAMDNGCPCPE